MEEKDLKARIKTLLSGDEANDEWVSNVEIRT
jgi:hypothetical protein